MEEQINSFDYTKNAEKLTERKWGKHVVSIWDGPDAQPAREQEEGSCGRFSRMVLQGFEVRNK